MLFIHLLPAQVPHVDEPMNGSFAPPQEEGRKPGFLIFKQQEKVGLKVNDSVLLPPIYEDINYVSAAVLVLKQRNKFGAATKNGSIYIPLEYDSIKTGFARNDALVVFKNGKAGVLNTKGEVVLPLQYDDVLYTNPSGKYSLVISGGKKILLYNNNPVKEQYQWLAFYNNLVVVKQQGKYGIIKDGQLILPPQYDSIYAANQINFKVGTTGNFHSDYRMAPSTLFIMLHHKLGLVQNDGTEIFTPDNDNILFDHHRKTFHIKKDSLTGLYLEATRKKTPVIYQQVYNDGGHFITVKKNGYYGVINYNTDEILPCEYDRINSMVLHGFKVKKNNKTGLINQKGQVVIPLVYDDIDPFSLSEKFKELYRISQNGYLGIAKAGNRIVVPPVYKSISEKTGYLVVFNGRAYGLYSSDGKMIADTVYQYIKPSNTKNSKVMFCYKDSLIGIIKDDRILYGPVFTSIGYIPNTAGLLNPYGSGRGRYQFVKDRHNKLGILDENTGQLNIPVQYDRIYQKLETINTTYFAIQKDGKYGIINDRDSVVIPLIYDTLDMNLANPEAYHDLQVLVKKGGQYGAVSLDHKVLIPIEYSSLLKLSDDNIYKAKKDSAYTLLNDRNIIINNGPFDDIAPFEGNVAPCFYQGTMRLVNKSGALVSDATPMEPHTGYTSFEELKQSLINALNSPTDSGLRIFAHNVAPSTHTLYLIRRNIFTREVMGFTAPGAVEEKYYKDLQAFKTSKWNTGRYNKTDLTAVDDYTFSDEGLITNKRLEKEDFGDPVFLGKFLGDAIRVNGYWISSYFMRNDFYR